jgi:hypothetical protein
MTTENDLTLQCFDPSNISDHATLMVVGNGKSQKEDLVQHLLGFFQDIPKGIIFSPYEFGSEDQDIEASEVFEPDALQSFLDKQKQHLKACRSGKSKEDARAFVVLDTAAGVSLRHKLVKKLFSQGSSYRLLVIVIATDPALGPQCRKNLDYAFLFNEGILKARRKSYEYFGTGAGKFEVFNAMLESCTEDNGCMVIDNTSYGDHLTDVFFWYQIEDPEQSGGSGDEEEEHGEVQEEQEETPAQTCLLM